MELLPVTSTKPKARISLQGATGSGLSYSALLLASGLCGSYPKIAVIDTDGTAPLYSYLGPFSTLGISAPFTAEKFIDAIELCERSGIEVIILDTLSAEWVGSGGMLDRIRQVEGDLALHIAALDGHQSVMRAITSCSSHLIATIRTKETYHLSIAGSKKEVTRFGLDPLQEESILHHFHTALHLDTSHMARVLKDRTGFFEEHGPILITEELSTLYAQWCGEDIQERLSENLAQSIATCLTTGELFDLLLECDFKNPVARELFLKRKTELQSIETNPIFQQLKPGSNGTDHLRATA